jgi:hypothetical protein
MISLQSLLNIMMLTSFQLAGLASIPFSVWHDRNGYQPQLSALDEFNTRKRPAEQVVTLQTSS